MAVIKLVRVDFRLMHGQVVANWLNQVDADTILIVDKNLAEDPFMPKVYKMAAPKGVRVDILSLDKALEQLQNPKYKDRKLLVLFKSVTNVKLAIEKGFPVQELQIGGLGSGPDRISIVNQISLDKKDAQDLVAIRDQGINVYLQTVPKEPALPLQKAVAKVL